MDADNPSEPPAAPPKPAGATEWSLRALITSVFVAALMGGSYPYIVMKLGFGPNVSVVAAFFGYLFLGISVFLTTKILRRKTQGFTRWENNIVQTAGTSAAQTAFMCVILAAFDLLGQMPGHNYTFRPEWYESFLWLTFASTLGILLAVPLRRHYIEQEKLTFADGVAAAETVMVLDARGVEAKRAARALYIATLASAFVWFLTTVWGGRVFGAHGGEPGFMPEIVLASMGGLTAATAGAGFQVSLLSIGSGMIVGNRINFSMAAGAILAWIIGPKLLVPEVIATPVRGKLLLWMMWPGTGMLIAGGLTALLLKWRTLARSFTTLSADAVESGGDVSIRLIAIGASISTLGLVIVQYVYFDLPIWLTLISAALSVPLMLVGLRVLGETNWGPISQLTNMMQAIFAALTPGNLTANLAASGTTGTIAVQSEAIMQDYKAGNIIGSTPRFLTYSQLIAAPIGALAVAIVYPLLRSTYGIGADAVAGQQPLTSPISARIAGFADILSGGFERLPDYALEFMAIGAALGIAMTLGETFWKQGKKWLPSATGLGIGMMVPGFVVFTMVLGGILMSLWTRFDKKRADSIGMPLASGLIAGEALMAIVMTIVVGSGLVSP
jgi:uncharacterized oligopeptide transporter (OPT) family protein